jgi:hypothetical protein
MVVLTQRFALLGVLASFAAFSLAPPAEAAAVAVRGKSSHSSSDLYSGTSSAHGASATSSNKAEGDPVIPLPSRLATQATSSVDDVDSQSSKKSKTSKKNKSKSKESSQKVSEFFASRYTGSDLNCSDFLPGMPQPLGALELGMTCLLCSRTMLSKASRR